MIHGNVEGIKNSFLKELDDIYSIKTQRYEFCATEIVESISRLTSLIEREISVAIDRRGNVVSVAIGDSTSVELPIIDIKEKKLSGIRVIHTHPNGYSQLSALDVTALLKLKLDSLVAVGVIEGAITDISLGFCSIENNVLVEETIERLSFDEAYRFNVIDKILEIDKVLKESEIEDDDSEKAIIVGTDTEESLDELEELAKACDIPVMYKVFQSRNKIDAALFIGSGKVAEIASLRQALRANLIIFDDELSGSQVRNLEEYIGAKVIDRTTLILEIFARRAKTREARIQVELAQLKYRASRLSGLGTVLSRTGGGVGTRGPGEKKLETDRRHIKERIYDLNDELKKIKKNREVQRERRGKQSIPQVSLVGYTNAGKSTLRNTLCDMVATKDAVKKEKVFEANMLFATLDTTTRAINLLDNRLITLTDTVGFVRKLPHELVQAFKSTLEEVIYSDLLVHVVDAASETAIDQIRAVEEVLGELGARDKEGFLVLNKIDLASEDAINEIKEEFKNYDILEISAKERINLELLLEKISEKLPYKLKMVEFIIPYSEGNIVSYLHNKSNIIEEDYKDEGTYIKAEVDDEAYNKYNEYILK
ncbi:GTPase HflX [Clostridium sp. 'White wine YQ']|uniref:GTPase HflX n=1 Tax=Clostridium sp. 'White wine YQ' TaxID=3027474 RepID=UPI0023658B3D|nr:GTPase HflX [Clostridium sp. 'White wine YQ']MDD7793137.1 GTPase HflX [Clostridium sp. 'White wine YQ']